MLVSLARSLTIARRNQLSCGAFARSALRCSGASRQALRVPYCGELLCFRRQLLRLTNGFGFLRVHAGSDLSSFTCVGHFFMASHFCHARRSVLQRSDTITCPLQIAPPTLSNSRWTGGSTFPSDSWLIPLFQNLDLLSDGRHPVVYCLGLRLEIGRDVCQLPGVVFQLIGIMSECFDNRLYCYSHDYLTS